MKRTKKEDLGTFGTIIKWFYACVFLTALGLIFQLSLMVVMALGILTYVVTSK